MLFGTSKAETNAKEIPKSDAPSLAALRARTASHAEASTKFGSLRPGAPGGASSSQTSQIGYPSREKMQEKMGSPFANKFSSQAPVKKSQDVSPTSPRFSAADIEQQVVEWDCEMDALDKKQEELLNNQWKLLRQQIGSLMGALSDVRTELADLKQNVVNKEVERVIENMIESHSKHDANHGEIANRVSYLEEVIGESLAAHKKELAEHKGEYAAHKTTMETRLEYIEGLIGDSADQHVKELEDANNRLADLHKAVAECARAEHHNSLEQRMKFLEKFLGESADKHDRELADQKKNHYEHTASVESRLEYIEGLIGDSADKHAKEIAAANSRLNDVHEAIQYCAKLEHHASFEERLAYLETYLGESADKHEKEIEGVQAKVGDLHSAIQKCVQAEHHGTLEERVNCLEKSHEDAVAGRVKKMQDMLNQVGLVLLNERVA
jgi:hypothetical protein